MAAKLYETVATQPTTGQRTLQDQVAYWKRAANQFREPSKVRFCERRMINYRNLLDKERRGA